MDYRNRSKSPPRQLSSRLTFGANLMTVTSAAPARPVRASREERKVLIGALVGTTIEWYDFFICARAAGLIRASNTSHR